MKKTEIIKSVTEGHAQISEQYVLVTGFLKLFNKKGPFTDVEGIIRFFNTSMPRHFLKENVIFNAQKMKTNRAFKPTSKS